MKKTFLPFIILLTITASLCGCKDATRAQFFSIGSKHRVSLYCGDKQIKQWVSTGNVSNEAHSDGYYFEDEETHRLVEISGTVIIEQIN